MCFILDSSGNTTRKAKRNWKRTLQFVISATRTYYIRSEDTRVGLVIFSDKAKLVFPLNRYSNGKGLREAIMNTRYLGGEKNITTGLLKTRTKCFDSTNGDRLNVRNVAILVTSGIQSTSEKSDNTFREAVALRKSGVAMVVIGISNRMDGAFLAKLSSPPHILNHNYFVVTEHTEIEDLMKGLVSETCESITGMFVSLLIQPEEHSFLTGPQIVLEWLSLIFFYKFS